ncbi:MULTISPECIES: phosphate signaling complex protein PhoU [unclassified Rummeliibacillus]|uniref:phosphate signaling complex protein PhoU n=1 Tax=unclassified Rummeliibacillus TaxID=2622809 RepID=UPI000E6643EF|nr:MULTISPECIES: phosphate signaling complex protein PhoU [unclassified Rummeliibacillus]RIJ62953.1 phosphate transport system regulatory protein PhoU [Rummeliibacillus sp. POC4]RPJ94830.1 phosphate transport system regulatory protein PhoU [Rummeliibacillus sp. TYF005]
MTPREKFDSDLKRVQNLLVELCERSIQAFEKSLNVLFSKNMDGAIVIIEQDRFINRLEEHLHDEIILLITKQQPVATDLRRLVALIRAAQDMERIGDYAVSIGKETIRIGENPKPYPEEQLREMGKLTVNMLKEMLDAFVKEDVEKAKEIALRDDQIDHCYGETMSSIEKMMTNESSSGHAIQLALICKYIERAADHATNLAEALFFIVQGKRFALNS